ncbi:low-affinity glucose transporter HXT3 [Xylaria venustula]|nr:low-affinity glucose transporter HXT3 [Xylaria venustula]
MIYAVMFLAGAGILFFGYDAAVMSQVNTNENYIKLMGADGGTTADSALNGGIVSVWFGGFAIGALIVGSIADRVGPAAGAGLQAGAPNLGVMLAGRIIGGIGCGHLNTIIPAWTAELSDPRLGGAFVAVQFTLCLCGITFVYWLEYGLVKTTPAPFAWRPRYLLKHGRADEAQDILERCGSNADHGVILEEIEEIKKVLRLEAETNAERHTYWSMIMKRDKMHTRRRIALGAGVQVMQKLTGIDFITTYAPEIFGLTGFKGDNPALLVGGNFISYSFSLALAIYLIDRVGRRRLMLSGSSIMAVMLISGGVLSRQISNGDFSSQASATGYGAGLTTVLYLYTFAYGSTWLTTCWVYPTECFPLATCAKGTALSTVAFSIEGAFVNTITPFLISAVGWWVVIIFALVNAAMLIPIYLFYIETATRHLEDLNFLFASNSPLVWKAEREFSQRQVFGPHHV